MDFVIQQTEKEAAHRRIQDGRLNIFIFIERLLGQLFAIAVAALGVGGGIYAGLNGQPVLGGTISTVTIGTLAVAFIQRNAVKNTSSPPKK